MKGYLAILLVVMLILVVEIYPHIENTVVHAGTKMATALDTEPDVGQLAQTKELIWGAGSLIIILGLIIEVTAGQRPIVMRR